MFSVSNPNFNLKRSDNEDLIHHFTRQLFKKIPAVHNIIFGQLATIAFTMKEIGISDELVRTYVI